MEKTVELGHFPREQHRVLCVRVQLEIRNRDGRGLELSVCGDTYYRGARDVESGGQIVESIRHLLATEGAALEKPRADIERLVAVWDRWHLNGMRAWCEHQRGWNFKKSLTLVRYSLATPTRDARRALKRRTWNRLGSGETVVLTDAERELVTLPDEVALPAEAPPPPKYEEYAREAKGAGWFTEAQHPEGLLSKPCPECGYRYGSSWLHEPLPADVVAFVEGF